MSKKIIGILLGIILVGTISYGVFVPKPSTSLIQPTSAPTQTQINTFSYDGQEGKDALILLKEKTPIEQDTSGLVTVINGRKADNAKKEFWAFYVNGEMAQVGPKEFITKNGDKIEWKIDTY